MTATKASRTAILVAAITTLGTTDVRFGCDFSGSMDNMMKKIGAEGTGSAAMTTRLNVLQDTGRATIKAIMPYDSNGITLTFFGKDHKTVDNVTSENFDATWKQGQTVDRTGTILAPVLTEMFEAALKDSATKQQCLFIFTDGEPKDKDAVVQVLTKYSNDDRVKDGRVGIGFIQIGNADGVGEFLASLDTALQAKYDITSRTTIEQFAILDLDHQVGYTMAGSHDPAEYEQPVAA
ncbi:hypothetical protein [Acinetobacter sp.]|uniref:hypothetical protein n=1 Tax=Acinetobacter sp. TaxID=472 RepID=UPI0037514B19